MPKYVYVQVHGVEQAAKIKADEAEESGKGTTDSILSIKLKGVQVGSFKSGVVDGWWIQEE